MKQEVVTLSQSLTQPISVAFICEYCGESNAFTQDIVGTGTKSGGKRGTDGKYTISPEDSIAIVNLAQMNLDQKVRNIDMKIAKGNYSWLNPTKCTKCNRFQSWNNRRLWNIFLKLFFGAPFIVFLVVGFPISLIYKDTGDYPMWLNLALGAVIFAIMIGAVIYLVKSLNMKSNRNRKQPEITMLSVR